MLMLLLPSAVAACSVGDFVPAAFTERCRKLLQNLETGIMAARMESPSAAEYLDRLAVDWVDFQLDHGAFPPPLFAGVATDAWASASWRIGRVISEVDRRQWPEEEIEEARFFLRQMCDPSRIEKNRDLLASWTAALLRDPGPELEAFGVWVESAYINPLREIETLVESDFPLLKARTQRMVRAYEEESQMLRRALPEARRELARSLVTRWRTQLRGEYEFWKTRLLW